MDSFEQVRAQVPVVFGRSLDRAIAGLQARAGNRREVVVFDRTASVWGELLNKRAELCTRFLHGLDGVVAGRTLPWPPQSRHALAHENDAEPLLELDTGGVPVSAPMPLEPSGLVEDTGLARTHGQFLAAVRAREPAKPLERVERLSAPAHWLAMAWLLMDEVSPDLPTVQRRMKHLVPALTDELLALYRRMGAAGAPAQSSVFGGLGEAGEAQDQSLPPLESLCRPDHELEPQWLKAFLSPGHARLDQALPPRFRDLVNAQIERLNRSGKGQPVPNAAMALSGVPSPNSALDAADWGSWADPLARARHLLGLKAQADTFEQVVALDVVRGLLGRLAGDPVLLRPVGEAVVALEPVLLRLALTQPRFITQQSHPARRLLDAVLHRAVEHNNASTEAFQDFFQPVRQAFQELNALERVDTGYFARALDRVSAAWRTRERALRAQQEQRLQAIRLADERQSLADRITLELSQLPEMADAPGFVVSFLCGWWSTVLAWARLSPSPEGPDASTCERATASLLWCVQPAVMQNDAAAVLAAKPELMRTLRQGLRSIGKTPEETEVFFEALTRYHEGLASRAAEAAAKAAAAAEADLGPATEPLPDRPDADEPPPAPVEAGGYRPEGPWLGRSELESSGVEEARFTDYAELGASRAASVQPAVPELDDAAVDAVMASLLPGTWIDLQSQGEWLRAQLAWSNPGGTLFMFHSAGGRTHSMSRRSCIRLIRARRLTVVTAAPDVQQAMGVIAGQPPGPR